MQRNKQRNIFIITFIISICLIAFLPALTNDFVNWDDPFTLINNPLIKQFSIDNLFHITFSHYQGKYHPLTLITYTVEYHFFGLKPFIYHLTNLLIHLINISLLFYLLKGLHQPLLVCTIVSILFGLHPIQTESVVWVSSRKDVLFTSFYLSAISFYVKQLNPDIMNKTRYKKISLALFFCSLLSKASAVSLPIALLTIDYAYKGKITITDLKQKIPYFLLSLLFGLITLEAVHLQQAFPNSARFTFINKFIFSTSAIFFYIFLILCPFKLSAYHPFPTDYGGSFPTLQRYSPLMFMVLCILIFSNKKLNKQIKAGFAFFLITLAPTMHIFAMNDSFVYERFLYIPSIGIFFIIAKLINKLFTEIPIKSKIKKIIAIYIALSYITLLISLTWQRCMVWKNSLSLWSDVINKYPDSPIGYFMRAKYEMAIDKPMSAIKDYTIAINIDPSYFMAYFGRATILSRIGKLNEAIKDYSVVLSINKRFVPAYINRGNLYSEKKQYKKAIADYTKAIKLNPKNPIGYLNRAQTYTNAGLINNALTDYETMLKLYPDNKFLLYKYNMLQKHIKPAMERRQ